MVLRCKETAHIVTTVIDALKLYRHVTDVMMQYAAHPAVYIFHHRQYFVVGRLSGSDHLNRGDRVCICCDDHAIGDEMHMDLSVLLLSP